MVETLEQREESMRKILRDIQNKRSFETFSFEEQRILKECYDAGCFEGVVMGEAASGRVFGEYQHEPRLTYKGLQFLSAGESPKSPGIPEIASELKSMNDDMRQQHSEEKTEKKIDRRFQLIYAVFSATAGSLVTLFVEHFDGIVSLIKGLFH